MSKKRRLKAPDTKVDRFIKRHDLDLTEEQRDELLHMIESLLANRERVIKHLTKQMDKVGTLDTYEPNKVLHSQIVGALRTTINAHGPITRKWIESAAKRIKAQLLA